MNSERWPRTRQRPNFTHLAWKNTPVEKGGIGNVQDPLVADLDQNIGRSYDAMRSDAIALRRSSVALML